MFIYVDFIFEYMIYINKSNYGLTKKSNYGIINEYSLIYINNIIMALLMHTN